MKTLSLLLLFPAAAFAQGGQIVSAPANALGEVTTINLRVVDDGKCMDRSVRLAATSTAGPSDRDRFTAGGPGRREILMKSYLQMYEDLQAATKPATCPAIDTATPDFIPFADMAAFLRDTKAKIATLDKQIADLDVRIADTSARSNQSPRGSVSTGSVLGNLRGTIGGINVPLPQANVGASRAELQRDRGELVKERARLQGLLPREATPQTGAPRGTTVPATPARGQGRGAPASSATAPVAIYTTKPQYTEDGRKNRIQGTVILDVTILDNGTIDPSSIKVVRGMGYGLDERAIETVREWRFTPGTRDGKPVATSAKLEVTYRLL